LPGSGKNTVPGGESHPQQIGDAPGITGTEPNGSTNSSSRGSRSTWEILYAGAIPLKYAMILEYINAALERANYEIIEDAEPYYGEIPELPGVFATGRTLEECRRNLAGVIDEWLIIRLRRGLPIPPVAGRTVGEIVRVDTGAGA